MHIVKCTIYFAEEGYKALAYFWRDCGLRQELPGGHSGLTKGVRNIPSMSPSKTVLDSKHSEPAKKLMIREEQKRTGRMKHLAHKFFHDVTSGSGSFFRRAVDCQGLSTE